MDFARATITRDKDPGPYAVRIKSQLKNRQTTQYLTSLKRELSLPCTGSWLPSRVPLDAEKGAYSAFLSTRNTPKKRYILSEKRESGMALKKREFTPESGTVDTYETFIINLA